MFIKLLIHSYFSFIKGKGIPALGKVEKIYIVF